jgi:hypothetical protein
MMGEQTKILTIAILILFIIPVATATIITGQGSSYTFNITNCQANPLTPVNCSTANIFYECTITNPAFIDAVEYRVDGIDYPTTQNSTQPSHFYLYYTKPQEYTTNTNPLNFDRQRITDVNNKKVNAYELISITRNCTTCPTTYTPTLIQNCNLSNQKIAQYTSSNETCSASYNATETCDYCLPDITTNTGTCNTNGTRTLSFTDNTYTTCCLATGLPSDCVINTPLYDNTTEFCQYLTQDFTCNLDQKPILNTKINVNCELPTENYTCIINTYQEIQNNTQTISSTLLATTPEYKKTNDNFIFYPTENEERTSFTTDHQLLNAYYTTKELRPENTYKIQVLCTAPQQNTLKYEEIVTPVYHTPDSILYRSIWGTQNNLLIIFWVALIILATALGYWIIRTYTANRR